MKLLTGRLFARLLLPAVALAPAATPLPAAAKDDDSSYRELVKKVTGGDLAIDFRALRFACLNASGCDARGENGDLIAMISATAEPASSCRKASQLRCARSSGSEDGAERLRLLQY